MWGVISPGLRKPGWVLGEGSKKGGREIGVGNGEAQTWVPPGKATREIKRGEISGNTGRVSNEEKGENGGKRGTRQIGGEGIKRRGWGKKTG